METNQEKVTRGVIYAFTRVILFVIAILVISLGFFTAMNSMNVNVIAKDAFALREEYVMQPNGLTSDDLGQLFTQDFIQGDALLNSTDYQDYDIENYYQRADVEAAIVWPWLDTVTVRATENVLDIEGTLSNSEKFVASSAGTSESAKASASDQTQVASIDKTPPDWKSAEYDVTLIKDPETSSWKVQEMKLIKEIKPVINQPSQTLTPTQTGAQETSKTSANPEEFVSASASASDIPTKSAK